MLFTIFIIHCGRFDPAGHPRGHFRQEAYNLFPSHRGYDPNMYRQREDQGRIPFSSLQLFRRKI